MLYTCLFQQPPLKINWGSRYISEPAIELKTLDPNSISQTDARMEHPLRRLGYLFWVSNQFEKSIAILKHGIEQVEKTRGQNDPLNFCFAHWLALAIADFAYHSGSEYNLAPAKRFALQALSGYTNCFGQASQWTIDAKSALGVVYYRMQDYRTAKELTAECVTFYENTSTPYERGLCINLHNQSLFTFRLKEFKEAQALALRCIEVQSKLLDPNHFSILESYQLLAECYEANEQYKASEKSYKACISGYEEIWSSKNHIPPEVYIGLGEIYLKQERLEDSERCFRQAIILSERSLPHGEYRDLLRYLGRLSNVFFLKWAQSYSFPERNSTNANSSAVDAPHIDKNPIVEICRLGERLEVHYEMLQYLSPLMYWMGDVLESRLALQCQAGVKDGMWTYSGRYCDLCGPAGRIGTVRFVCMQCWDVDLCEGCMVLHNAGQTQLESCVSHLFLDASLPSSTKIPDEKYFKEEVKSLLRRVIEKYADVEEVSLRAKM
jgi:tetratricopeptide (TPR) repeat protein